jgi:hypothetical protein
MCPPIRPPGGARPQSSPQRPVSNIGTEEGASVAELASGDLTAVEPRQEDELGGTRGSGRFDGMFQFRGIDQHEDSGGFQVDMFREVRQNCCLLGFIG